MQSRCISRIKGFTFIYIFLHDILSTFTTREYKPLVASIVSISIVTFLVNSFSTSSLCLDFRFPKVSFFLSFLSFPYLERYKTIKRWYLTSCKKETVYDYDVATRLYDASTSKMALRFRVLILVLR